MCVLLLNSVIDGESLRGALAKIGETGRSESLPYQAWCFATPGGRCGLRIVLFAVIPGGRAEHLALRVQPFLTEPSL